MSQQLKTELLSFSEEIKKVDSLNELDLYCYASCDSNSDPFIQESRGLVFEGDELILKSFAYTPEYTLTDKPFLETTHTNFTEYQFFKSYEGTLLRVFHHKDVWYISTHRRLDAFKSRWASKKSFGELFVFSLLKEFDTNPNLSLNTTDVLPEFFKLLDTSCQYMFLLQHNHENRIVCLPPEDYPRIYHVGTFKQFELDMSITLPFSYPPKLTFDNWESVLEYVEKIDYNESQGVIMYHGVKQLKVLNSTYQYLYTLRGNEVSVRTRYLQLRHSDSKVIEDFTRLYPTFAKSFQDYERVLSQIGIQIFNAYIQRFIYRQHVVLYPEEYQVMKECHAWHLSDRRYNRVSIEKVNQVLSEQPSHKLNKMIRRFYNIEKLNHEVNHSVLNMSIPKQ